MKKEKEESNDKCPWLDKGEEMRTMSDRDIKKYVHLEKLCISETKYEEVMDML